MSKEEAEVAIETVMNAEVDLRIISLGAGVQSSALYLMALDGLLTPRPDYAIFADTQQEPPWVYENVWRLQAEGGDRIPVRLASGGDLGEAVKCQSGEADGRFASVPFWLPSEKRPGHAAPGRRQCTREYKIDVVKQDLRRILGVAKGERCKYRVEEWIGISLDEASRAAPSRTPWITTRWPFLLDRTMRRTEIQGWLTSRGWPALKKSACVFCPYRQDIEWARWREEEPEQFARAVKWDELIRIGGQRRGIRGQQFLSRSLVALSELPPIEELRSEPSANLDLFQNECAGMCGI